MWIDAACTLVGFAGGCLVSYGVVQWHFRPDWARQAREEWLPGSEYAERLYPTTEQLEELAARRRLHDSGRKRPPRADAGPPARITKARIRPR